MKINLLLSSYVYHILTKNSKISFTQLSCYVFGIYRIFANLLKNYEITGSKDSVFFFMVSLKLIFPSVTSQICFSKNFLPGYFYSIELQIIWETNNNLSLWALLFQNIPRKIFKTVQD